MFSNRSVFFKDCNIKPAFRILLQSIVNDDSEKVKIILGDDPSLLLVNHPANLIIESQLTWQKFYAESALKMAVKLKRLNMINVLLPYYDKLEQTEYLINAKKEALACWKAYEMQKNAKGKDEVVIPEKYANLAQSLIERIKNEEFRNGFPALNDDPDNASKPITVELSRDTESKLDELYNMLIPSKAINLDDYINPELFLLSILKAYENYMATTAPHRYPWERSDLDWARLDAFSIRVIGFVQSTLPPELASIFCAGVYNVHFKNKAVSSQSTSYVSHYKDDRRSFYRTYPGSRSGLGFEYCFSSLGHVSPLYIHDFGDIHFDAGDMITYLEDVIVTKSNKFKEITESLQEYPKPTH